VPAGATVPRVSTPTIARRPGSAVRDFLSGAALLARGARMYAGSGGLLLLGVLPALLAALLVVAGLVVLGLYLPTIADAVTGFAAGWSGGARSAMRYLAEVALLGAAALLAVITFTSLTLAIGDPFYEKISERIERRLGDVPEPVDRPWYRDLARNLKDSLRLVAFSALVGLPLFLVGLVPVVGQIAAAVLGAVAGGWMLAVELTGASFARRGMYLGQRRAALRAHRPVTLGFGVATFLCFLVPLGAILLMPAAVAGATLLTRRVTGRPVSAAGPGAPPAGPVHGRAG
jgi:CysZ protein